MLATDTLFSLPRVCLRGQKISREIQVSKGRNQTCRFVCKNRSTSKKKKKKKLIISHQHLPINEDQDLPINKVRVGCILSCGRSPIPHFGVLCDILLNRRTATSNLFVLFNKEMKKSTVTLFMSLFSNRS